MYVGIYTPIRASWETNCTSDVSWYTMGKSNTSIKQNQIWQHQKDQVSQIQRKLMTCLKMNSGIKTNQRDNLATQVRLLGQISANKPLEFSRQQDEKHFRGKNNSCPLHILHMSHHCLAPLQKRLMKNKIKTHPRSTNLPDHCSSKAWLAQHMVKLEILKWHSQSSLKGVIYRS